MIRCTGRDGYASARAMRAAAGSAAALAASRKNSRRGNVIWPSPTRPGGDNMLHDGLVYAEGAELLTSRVAKPCSPWRSENMTLPRRGFVLSMVAASAAMPALTRLAGAADYPTRPVRIFEGFGGGGTPDLISRIVAQWLSQRLG